MNSRSIVAVLYSREKYHDAGGNLEMGSRARIHVHCYLSAEESTCDPNSMRPAYVAFEP